MNILVIAVVGQPGRPFGVCLQQTGFALLGIGSLPYSRVFRLIVRIGVCLGTALFPILAVLGHAPVAQGAVFAVIVYRKRDFLWPPD